MDSAFFDNPDLPDTRSEMALPLRFLEDTFGALDLQSIEPNAFTQEDIDVLSILADQVAIAIQNARSLESAQRAAHDVEVAYQQITSQAWSQFAKDQQMRGYQFDGVETRSITNWSSEKDGSTLLIPVRLRGKEIGQIKMRAHQTDRTWTQDEIMMTQAAAERAALALENARLLEDAQNRASQERIIGDISAKLSSSAELEKIMQIAVKELKQALGASEVSLKIGSNEKEY
jgi:GAF domain-containing protein